MDVSIIIFTYQEINYNNYNKNIYRMKWIEIKYNNNKASI